MIRTRHLKGKCAARSRLEDFIPIFLLYRSKFSTRSFYSYFSLVYHNMTFDIKSVRVGSEMKPTPLGLKTLQTLHPSVLRDLMHKQARKENNEKANIVFIDCQSKEGE